MFDNVSFGDHERVVFAHDAKTGLRITNNPTSHIADDVARQLLAEAR